MARDGKALHSSVRVSSLDLEEASARLLRDINPFHAPWWRSSAERWREVWDALGGPSPARGEGALPPWAAESLMDLAKAGPNAHILEVAAGLPTFLATHLPASRPTCRHTSPAGGSR